MTDLYSALVAIVWGLHGPESVPYTIRSHWRKALLYQHRFDINIREIYICCFLELVQGNVNYTFL